MKAFDIDTLSRSCHIKGLMQGENILSFLPLHNSAVERSKGLLNWIRTWWPKDEKIIYLSPDDWYLKVFCRRYFI